MVLAIIALIIPLIMFSCKKDEERVTTSIALDKTDTGPHDIGETVTASVTIVAEQVAKCMYYKVVDLVRSDSMDITSALTQTGTTFTYDFSYVLATGDDVGTLGFEFVITDDLGVMQTASILVTTNLSVPGMFIKSDWTITAEDHPVWGDLLAAHDAAKIFRFSADGMYQVDLSPAHAGKNHHFCYWVYKETPSNGDTLAVLRLVRRLLSGDTGLDENYDFRITAASESEMTMFWDIAVWGILDIERTFTSQTKGAFQPYGTVEMADTVLNQMPHLDCSNIDNALLTID